MKNTTRNKVCSFVLALLMAFTVLPTTVFATEENPESGDEQNTSLSNTTTIVVDVGIPEGFEADSSYGAAHQELTDGKNFVNILIKPSKSGVSFPRGIDSYFNTNLLAGSNLTAYLGVDGLVIGIVSGGAVTKDVNISSSDLQTMNSYVMYPENSIVGETGEGNKMNAQYNVSTGMLTFNGFPYSDTYNTLEYHGNADPYNGVYYYYDITRFVVNVYKGNSSEANTSEAALLYFNLGSGTVGTKVTPDTTYTKDDVVNPSINMKKIIEDKKDSLTDSDYLWVKITPCTEYSATDKSFFINAGKVSDIKGDTTNERTVEIKLGDNIVKTSDSGDLKQTLDSWTSFKNIILETKPGYIFDTGAVADLNKVLAEKGLTAVKSSHYQLSIMPKTTSSAIVSTEATVNSSKVCVIYNGTSTVGESGDKNKMNAKYDSTSGKLTFDCGTTDGLERVTEDGKREYYNGMYDTYLFDRFTSTVKVTRKDGTVDDIANINIGGLNFYDKTYSSASTISPVVLIKKLINDLKVEKKLKDTDKVSIVITACNDWGIIRDYDFTIEVGTVDEIINGKEAEPTPTATTVPKKSSGWDDGGPFTTDTCGNVFDRWGNMIYEAKGCNVGGYNLVRTSVED